MKCHKCSFITFDYLNECPKCKTPVSKDIEVLYPLRFRPNPPDFTADYLEAISGIPFMKGQGPSTQGQAEEIALDELSLAQAFPGIKPETYEKDLPEVGEEPQTEVAHSFQLEELEVSGQAEAGKTESLELSIDELALEETEPKEPALDEVMELKLEDVALEGSEEVPSIKVEPQPLAMAMEDQREKDDSPIIGLKLEDLRLEDEEEDLKDIPIGIKMDNP